MADDPGAEPAAPTDASGGAGVPARGMSRTRTAWVVAAVVVLVAVLLGAARVVTSWDDTDTDIDALPSPTVTTRTPTADPTSDPPSSPPSSTPTEDGPTRTYTVYAHPPIDPVGTPPEGYVRALEERSDWADGLFLYYPASLEFGARPEIDALQKAYPEGVPLTVSPKNADPAGVAAFRDQLTPQQAALTVWERWQEPADDFTTAAERAGYRADVLSDIEILRPAGIRVGVHEQCWTLDPANHQRWAGEQALLQLIPPEVDIVTATCLGYSADDSGPVEMGRFLDFMHEHYSGVEVGFTSLAWTVPAGTPAGSPLRAERAAAAQDAVDFAVDAGVTELGWFDFPDWDDRDSDVGSDPALLELLSKVSARRVG